MGLFSFLKNAGAKLFNAPEKKAKTEVVPPEVLKNQKIMLLKGVVESLGIEVEGFQVDIDGDTVHVSGKVDSQADKEKVILALGNVEGVAAVDDKMEVEAPEPEAQFYEVKRGDSLSKIAKAYYGNAMKYPIIFEANKPMLSDPDKIYPGQMLRIPPLGDN